MELLNEGKIKRICIPEDWVQERSSDEWMITYSARIDTDVKLSFYYRGKPASPRTAENFQKVLQKPAHRLSAEEHESIEVVIRDASEEEYFDLAESRTEEINGNMVLVVEGFWKLSNVDSMGIFIDCKGDGREVREIYYLAPKDKFARFLPQIKAALNSIEWID